MKRKINLQRRDSNTHYRLITRRDIPFLGIMFLLLGGLSLALFTSFKNQSKDSGSEVIGYLKDVGNVVQRKGHESSFWQDTSVEEPAYAQDLIRTGESSFLVLNLKGGLTIDLDSNSMILLSYSADELNSIDVQYGSLYVDARVPTDKESGDDSAPGTDPTAIAEEVVVKSGDNQLSVAGGLVRVDAADTGEMKVTGLKGAAVVTSNGVTRQVKSNQQIVAVKGDIQGKTDNFWIEKVMSPKSNSKLVAGKQNQSVLFDFELGGSVPSQSNLVLEISTQRNFSSKALKRISLEKNRIASARYRISVTLSTGIYYWRVADVGQKNPSNWNRFSTLYKPLLRFQHPANDAVIITNQQKERVKFIWSASADSLGNKARYHLRVAKDKSMKDLVHEENSSIQTRFLSLQSGTYYAQLSYFLDGKIIDTGQTQIKFQIKYDSKPKSLAVYSPRNNQSLYQEASTEGSGFSSEEGNVKSKKHGYWFRWENYAGASHGRVLISVDRKKEEILKRKVIKRNYFWLAESELKSLPVGDYFWHVEYLDKNSQVLAVSDPRSMRILAKASEKYLLGILETLSQIDYEILKESYPERSIRMKSGRTFYGLVVYRSKSRLSVISRRRIINFKLADVESVR